MQKTSHIASEFFFEPIELSKSFPVSEPDFKNPPSQAHVHDCFEIGLCCSGAGVFMIADKVFNCMPGDAIFINHREFHILKDASPANSDWRFINLDPVALLAGWVPGTEAALNIATLSGKSFNNIVHESEHPDIVFMVRQLISELDKKSKGYQSVIRSLAWGLFVLLQRQLKEQADDDLTNPTEVQRIYPALQYISSHYADDIEMKELAEICHCSLSTFRRMFKRSLGCLPIKYLTEYRLKIAIAALTASNRTILEVATDSGFSTLSSFNRHFKEKYKMTPREYRKSHNRT